MNDEVNHVISFRDPVLGTVMWELPDNLSNAMKTLSPENLAFIKEKLKGIILLSLAATRNLGVNILRHPESAKCSVEKLSDMLVNFACQHEAMMRELLRRDTSRV